MHGLYWRCHLGSISSGLEPRGAGGGLGCMGVDGLLHFCLVGPAFSHPQPHAWKSPGTLHAGQSDEFQVAGGLVGGHRNLKTPAWRCSQLLSHHPPEGAAGALGVLGAQKSAVLGVPQSVCRKGGQDVSITHLVLGTSISPDSHPCCSRYPDSACSASEDTLPSLFPPCPASHLEGEGRATTQRGEVATGVPTSLSAPLRSEAAFKADSSLFGGQCPLPTLAPPNCVQIAPVTHSCLPGARGSEGLLPLC